MSNSHNGIKFKRIKFDEEGPYFPEEKDLLNISENYAVFRGHIYQVGDGVILRGSNNEQLFAVITCFKRKQNSTLLKFRWLIPKRSRISDAYCKRFPLSPQDFDLGPEADKYEDMNILIKKAFRENIKEALILLNLQTYHQDQ